MSPTSRRRSRTVPLRAPTSSPATWPGSTRSTGAAPRCTRSAAWPRTPTDQAGRLDAERRDGQTRGPLHGVPVLVKDNIDVAGLPTTAGALALEHSVPDRDAAPGDPAARGRRRGPRQDQPHRAGQLHGRADAQRLLIARRAGAQPLRREPDAVRVEQRLRARPPRSGWRPSPSAPRRTARSCARATRRAWSGVKPTLGLVQRRRASCRSPAARTAPARCAAPSADAAALLGCAHRRVVRVGACGSGALDGRRGSRCRRCRTTSTPPRP